MVGSLVPVMLVGAALGYALGVSRLWSSGRTARLIQPWQVVSFAGAFAALTLALVGPLEQAADDDLPSHMVQHLLLLLVAPPLLALSAPLVAMVHALPAGARRRVRPALGRVMRSQDRRGWVVWTVAAFG